eukprot:CAMPEP_0176495944 /NCGR_PEP_ID=MMETSP0200_2-20121128/10933_1 /TAXON_ID=947934 /ORGANISM="Chaetoceros sp., Strain GSL56" /LENGTH=409 /DNA_ID=CAMNT_0017893869 /DNA_START=245 /DNA_END=1471 /DNA_ORIENTATION=+
MTRIYNTKSTTSSSTSNANESSSGMIPDIEDLHRQAVLCKSNTYIDPSTGFTVFTEFAHLKRGTCCGNKCRHCPFGWENVDLMQTKSQGGGISISSSSSSTSQQDTVTTTTTITNNTGNDENDHDENGSLSLIKPKPPRVKSGQRQEIAKLLEKIHQGTYFENNEKFEYPQNNMSSSSTLLEKDAAEKEEKKKNFNMKKMDTLDSLSSLGYTVAPSITATSFSSSSTSSSSSSSSSSSFNTSINSASNSSHGSCTSCTCDNIPLDEEEEAEEHEEGERKRCTSKNVPYTRSGDLGMSMLLNGERRSKDDEAFESMGTVDELCSTVGVVHVELDYMKEQKNDHLQESSSFKENIIEVQSQLVEIMCHLFDIGSHLAKPRKNAVNSSLSLFEADGVGNGFHKEHVDILETW